MNRLPIDGTSAKQKLEKAILLLTDNGYLVRGPLLLPSQVKTTAALVRFFYDRMAFYNPNHRLGYAGNKKRDLAAAKKFIESRRSTGISLKQSISECCELIEVLFKHEKHLKLSYPVASMVVLGQESMGWVSEKLVTIYNGLSRDVVEEEELKFFEGLYRHQESIIDEDALLTTRKKLDRILNEYGKEED